MNLEQEIERVRAELHAENQRGALKDSHKVSNLETKLEELSRQLDEQNRKAEHEEKVAESQTEIAYIMDTISVDGITMRELCRNEEAYQLLRAVVQETMLQRDERRLKEQKELEYKNDELKYEKEQLQRRYDELYEDNSNQRHEIHQLRVSLEDANKKRDAAAAELETAQKEIERLNSQVDDLRKEISVGAVAAAKTIDVTESLEQYKRKLEEEKQNRIPIYNVQPLDNRRSRFQAQYAETDEIFEDSYLYFEANYREVTAAEAEVFRNEYRKRMEQDSQEDQDGILAPPPISFQDEDTTPEYGLDQGDVGGAMEEQAVGSVEARLTALEQRVAALEIQSKGEAA